MALGPEGPSLHSKLCFLDRTIKAGLRTFADREKIRKMAPSKKLSTARSASSRPAENQLAFPLTPRQRRILRLLQQGDLIWEMADDPGHRTVYDEKRGCHQRLSTATVTALEQQGWIQRRPNLQTDRLDSWECTLPGRAMMAVPQLRPSRKVTPAPQRRRTSQEAKNRLLSSNG